MSNNTTPVCSVIIPTCNSSKTIIKTLDSVFSQTFQDFEVIVVDDGSTDCTVSLVNRSISDSRIQVFPLQENKGVAYARNVGISKAKGRFIAFLDSDDLWLNDKLSKQILSFDGNCVGFVCSSYYIREINKSNIEKIVSPPIRLNSNSGDWYNPVGFLTLVYDTHVCGKVYLPEIKTRSDWGLVVALLKRGVEGLGISDPLAILQLRKNSLTANKIFAAHGTYIFGRVVLERSIFVSIALVAVQLTISFFRRKDVY